LNASTLLKIGTSGSVIPRWLVQRWIIQHGEERTRKLLEWNQQTPRFYALDTADRITPEEASHDLARLNLKATPWENYYEIPNAASKTRDSLQKDHFYFQDPSTRIAPSLLTTHGKRHILDACAAPGGKTVHLSKLSKPGDHLYACDSSQKRLKTLGENLERLGLEGVITHRIDWTDSNSLPEDFPPSFEAILADVPCSSCGIIQKHPEIRWRLTPRDYEIMPQLQTAILSNLSTLVSQQGELVYSTCSVDRAENESVVKAFLDSEQGQKFTLKASLSSLPPENEHDGVGAFLLCKTK
jgi:16S rRNA (cytosine967-C5)-methyltransferase